MSVRKADGTVDSRPNRWQPFNLVMIRLARELGNDVKNVIFNGGFSFIVNCSIICDYIKTNDNYSLVV